MSTRLTTTDIKALRSKIRHKQHRKPGIAYKPITLMGGPLGGLQPSVEATLGPRAIIGWACTTPVGVVQILYRYADGNHWRFDRFEGPT